MYCFNSLVLGLTHQRNESPNKVTIGCLGLDILKLARTSPHAYTSPPRNNPASLPPSPTCNLIAIGMTTMTPSIFDVTGTVQYSPIRRYLCDTGTNDTSKMRRRPYNFSYKYLFKYTTTIAWDAIYPGYNADFL